MSLVAWYPLNGDYKNYTAENMGLTQTSTPSYENGKIGRALSLGGFKWTAEQTAKILNNKEVSIALWIYVNADEGSTTNRAMIFGNDNMLPPNNRRFSLYQYPNCNSLHWSWQNGNSSDTFTAGVLNGVLPSYKWTHICVTYKNPIGKIYINGELKKTFNGVYNSESFEYETQVIHNSSYHYLNDYRFYNHCLSDAEVKEISKGLVLHYTMDSLYGEGNIIKNSYNGCNGGNAIILQDEKYNGFSIRYLKYEGTSFRDAIGLSNIIEPNPNEYYTASFWAKGNCQIRAHFYPDCCVSVVSNQGFKGTSGDGQCDFNLTKDWARYWVTWKTKSDVSGLKNFIVGRIYNQGEGAECYIAGVKFEKGEVATLWCPNIADTDASDYGLDKVCDNSGYGNDGASTDLEYSIDRKKGLTSTKYNGSTSKILTQKGSFSWFNFDECTISCWMKPTSSPSEYTGSVGVSYDGNPSGKTLCLNNHGGKLCVESIRDSYWMTYFSDYILPINEWSHCVITINKDSIIKFYVNGELIKTDTLNFGSTTHSNANAFFQVGCDLAGKDEYYQGYYDDVRFYTTSLSADDVLKLYKETQKIDNKGNLYCSELNEVERRVEYLESNGTQYIDTGIISISNKFQIEMQFSLNQSKDYQNLFCCRESSSHTRTLFVKNLNGFRNDQDGWQNVIAAPLSLNTKYILKSSQTQFKLSNNVLYNYQSGSGVTINRKVTLLNSYDVGSGVMSNTYQFNGKIYYCKIWDDNTLVRDFLPTISTEEGRIGEACLFDTVTNTYFYNQGTGKFTTNLDESTSNIDFTSKGIVNTDYIIEGKEQAKIKNDGNIIEVNNLYEN